jgi:hypothetical protein
MRSNIMAAPEHTIRCGGIQIAIWSNETSKGVFQSITIDKSYKDGADWKRTKSFKPVDLVKIQLGLNKVLEYLYLKDVITPAREQDGTPVKSDF